MSILSSLGTRVAAMLYDALGNPLGTLSNPVRIDPTGTTTQPVSGGGGGGGGPATIADGADVAEGATTDTAVVSDANGTISGKLRGLVKIFADVWDSVNHRLNVAVGGSLPAGTNVIGHVITDTNSVTDVTDRSGRLLGNVTANQGSANATPWNDNLAQVGGAAIALGQAVAGSSVPVVLPAAQITTLTPPTTVTSNQGAANTIPWNENIAQIGGVAVSLGQQIPTLSIPVIEAQTVVDLFQQMLDELRVMRSAIVKLACDDGRAVPADFSQARDIETSSFVN